MTRRDPTPQANGVAIGRYIKRMRELTKSVAERNRKIHRERSESPKEGSDSPLSGAKK